VPASNPTRLFHITAIANLPKILAAGALLSKNAGAAVGINYQNIAHGGAQGTRAIRAVRNPPGGVVHDYVPFYFAPRSPMLFAINSGRVSGCDWRQPDIVHIETTVQNVVALERPFVFYDRNATLAFSEPFTDLADLDLAVAWDLLTEAPQLDGFCKYWRSDASKPRYAERMERRQAEFLVKVELPLSAITRIGVIDVARQTQVQAILDRAGVKLSVVAMPDWYF
jgi:ssDNA thymidine ADP-ribosyltransferase, DarT